MRLIQFYIELIIFFASFIINASSDWLPDGT